MATHPASANIYVRQAKSMKLAKQLASINFLREAIGTRMQLDLDQLLQEGAGGRAAALTAALAAGAAATAATAASAAGGNGKGSGQDGSTAAAEAAAATAKAAAAEAEKLAMGDGGWRRRWLVTIRYSNPRQNSNANIWTSPSRLKKECSPQRSEFADGIIYIVLFI